MTDGQHSAAEKSVPSRRKGARAAALLGYALAVASLGGAPAGCIPTHGSSNDEPRSTAEYDLGREAFQSQRLREALDHVQRALKMNEDNADAAYLGVTVMLAFCALDERSSDCRLPEAEKFARQAIASQPDHRDARNALGVILIQEHRYDEAIAVLKPLTEDMIYGSPEKSWGNLGWAYLQRGSTEEAIDALRRAVAVQPLFCVGQYRLGLAFEKKGDLGAAREALTRALDTDRPECKRLQDAFSARARIAGKQGQRDDARADLMKCREIGADTPVGQRCAVELQTYQ
jgi:type IV pilus assembly protein PilF